MKPEDLIEVVNKTTTDAELSERDVTMLHRYFLREYFQWLPFRAISDLTKGAHHSSVISSIKSVNKNQRFALIKHVIKKELDNKLNRRRI